MLRFGLQYLMMAFVCELDTVVWYQLVDLAVLVAFGLGMADENDHLERVLDYVVWYHLVSYLPVACPSLQPQRSWRSLLSIVIGSHEGKHFYGTPPPPVEGAGNMLSNHLHMLKKALEHRSFP